MRLNWMRATTLGVAAAALLSACATTPPPPPALGGTPANILASVSDPARPAGDVARDEERHLGQFYASARHTIQVDFGVYCADLKKELVRGARRARAAGNALPVPARAVTPAG